MTSPYAEVPDVLRELLLGALRPVLEARHGRPSTATPAEWRRVLDLAAPAIVVSGDSIDPDPAGLTRLLMLSKEYLFADASMTELRRILERDGPAGIGLTDAEAQEMGLL